MSQYTQKEETEIVKTARDLTAAIQIEEEELEKLRSQSYSAPPLPPSRTVYEQEPVEYVSPNLVTERQVAEGYGFFSKFLWEYMKKAKKKWPIVVMCLGLSLFILFLVIAIVLFATAEPKTYTSGYYTYTKESANYAIGFLLIWLGFIALILPPILVRASLASTRGRYVKRITAEANNSPEMIAERQRADAENMRRQKAANDAFREKQDAEDERYEAEKNKFDTETLPTYEGNKARWVNEHNTKILMVMEDIENNKKALDELYETTSIIAYDYRELWKLEWLYKNMSTQQDYTMLVAMDRLDQAHLRGVIQSEGELNRAAVKHMETRTMQGLRNVYAGIEDIYDEVARGNDLSAEQLETVRKTRRDNNIAHALNFLQHLRRR